MKNRINLFLVLLILISLTASSQQKKQNERLTIPLESIDGRPEFTMMINGKGPYNFVFDTGKMGEEININPNINKIFQFKVVDTLLLGDPTGKNSILLPIVSIPSISISSLSFTKVKAIVDTHLSNGVNGVVGLLFFKNFLLTLDLSKNQLILEQPEPGLSPNSNTIPYESMMGIPVIKILIGSHKTKAELDCGNTRASIVIPEALAKQLNFTGKAVDLGKAKTMFNEVEMKKVKIHENLNFGPYLIEQPIISFPSFGNLVNLGTNFLRSFQITFDQKQYLIKLIKNNDDSPFVN